MVARSPLKQRKIMAALNPVLLREAVQKVDRCMARLQELQYTVSGGNKMISGVSLSPRSTRGYLRTSLRCKQESIRIKNSAATRKSPVGKFPANSGGEWRRMSLPAMLVGETMGEILQASQFAKEIVSAISQKTNKISPEDPKTPLAQHVKRRPILEETDLRVRRKKEKQTKPNPIRSDSKSPTLRRARSRINFRVSPTNKRETNENENSSRYNIANRVSPRNKPWAKKTVLFPNPLFTSSSSSANEQKKLCKTRSPVIARKNNNISPHKFLIKSPVPVKIKSPILIARSPPKKVSAAAKLRRSFSPSRLANRLVAMSPLKSRRSSFYHSNNNNNDGNKIDERAAVSGLKQRPSCSIPMGISARRI